MRDMFRERYRNHTQLVDVVPKAGRESGLTSEQQAIASHMRETELYLNTTNRKQRRRAGKQLKQES